MCKKNQLQPFIAALPGAAGAAWPLCLGYVPIGLAFGVLAQKAGLGTPAVMLMSAVVFAGSSQFIAVSMMAANAGALSIVFTTFMVNLRHLLMSSALSLYVRREGRLKRTLMSYGITDESFALHATRFPLGEWDIEHAIAANQLLNLVWILSTTAGSMAGQFIPAGAMGIDFALNAMFICLLVFQLQGMFHWITAGIAAGMSTLLCIVLPGNLYVVIAAVIAAALGAYCNNRFGKGKARINERH
jgi:4-azaleucine resistance transporter AzlC